MINGRSTGATVLQPILKKFNDGQIYTVEKLKNKLKPYMATILNPNIIVYADSFEEAEKLLLNKYLNYLRKTHPVFQSWRLKEFTYLGTQDIWIKKECNSTLTIPTIKHPNDRLKYFESVEELLKYEPC